MKPREYWVREAVDLFGNYDLLVFDFKIRDDDIHVIEYSEVERLKTLLRDAKSVLDNHWFSFDGEDERNNEDVIAMSEKIDHILNEQSKLPRP